MKISDFKAIEKEIGCRFKKERTGRPDWIRLFVLDNRGCTIGRLSFQDGELFTWKSYKRDYRRDLCESDIFSS